MPEAQSKSAAQNYATRDNIIYPGTREQADAVEAQAAEELAADRREDVDSVTSTVESDQALEVEQSVRDQLAADDPKVQHATDANEEARAQHGSIPPEDAVDIADTQVEQEAVLAEANEVPLPSDPEPAKADDDVDPPEVQDPEANKAEDPSKE